MQLLEQVRLNHVTCISGLPLLLLASSQLATTRVYHEEYTFVNTYLSLKIRRKRYTIEKYPA